MPNILNNPAGRLHMVLTRIRSKTKETKPNPNSGSREVKLRTILAEISGNNVEDTAKLYIFLIELSELARQSIEAIKKVPEIDHSAYIKPLEKIEKGLISANVEVQAKTFVNRVLTDVNMLSLQFCADMLLTVYPEAVIPKDELAALQKEIESLLEEVLKMELPDDLKAFLLDNLEKMRQAIIGYQIYGNVGIKKALDSVIGATFFRRDDLVSESKDEAKKRTLEKFFAIIEKTTKVLSLAEKIKSLGAPAISLLLPHNQP